jgi:hypothetical protein
MHADESGRATVNTMKFRLEEYERENRSMETIIQHGSDIIQWLEQHPLKLPGEAPYPMTICPKLLSC